MTIESPPQQPPDDRLTLLYRLSQSFNSSLEFDDKTG